MNHDLLGWVHRIAFIQGAYRGVLNLPFYFAIPLCLHFTHGVEFDAAFADTFIFVIGGPSFFSLPLEILFGWLAARLGIRGNFRMLVVGKVFRCLGAGLMFASLWFESGADVIWGAIAAVIVGEVGRACISGAFEDCYRYSAMVIENVDAAADNPLFAECSVVDDRWTALGELALAIVGTLCVGNAIDGHGFSATIAGIPFAMAAIASAFGVVVALRWSDWYRRSDRQLRRRRLDGRRLRPRRAAHQTKPLTLRQCASQVGVFVKHFDWLWALGIGFSTLLAFFVATMTPLIHGELKKLNDGGTFAWCLVACAIAGPAAKFLATFVFHFVDGDTPQDKKETALKWLSVWFRADALWLLWGAAAVCSICFLKTEVWWRIPLIAFVLRASFQPIMSWARWLRMCIADERRMNPLNAGAFGTSNAFYLSIFEGTSELAFAIQAVVLYMLGEEVRRSETYRLYYGLACFATMTVCFVLWRGIRSFMRPAGDNAL